MFLVKEDSDSLDDHMETDLVIVACIHVVARW